ncbi:MAG: biotin/lipoyl-binding protein [Lachnospiraceae bacterium]|nr:biotin/lipoyl-binding protein [Lachnospiraceae bacterium]
MSRKHGIKIILCTLTALSLLCGCEETVEVPALIEPVSANEAYRPVEKRMIGKMIVEVGNVVPTEYCHYYRKVTVLKEICCDVGQYVNEGDILATADIETLQHELEDVAAERALCVSLHDARQPLYALNQDLVEIDKKSCVNVEDFKGAADCENRLNMEKENYVYDEKLYEYMLKQYDKKIAEINKDINDGSLKARCSGYVTYIKDTAKDNVAKINEAVVIIADNTDTYIEVPDLNLDNYLYRNYEYKYAMIGAEEVPIEEYVYTGDESVYAMAQGSYPNIRFKAKTQDRLYVGESVVLCFYAKKRNKELCVGNDSINSDEGGSYVYVKGKDGEKEKRYFTNGPSDDYYTTVIDGLEEGEEVFYVQEAASPARFNEYKVERTDHVQMLESKDIKKAETLNTAYFAPCSGTVEEIPVEAGSKVSKGDVLMVIDSGGGAAAISEIENERKRAASEYEKKINSLDQEAYDLTAQIKVTTLETANYHLCEPEYRFQTERMKDQAKIAVIEKQLAQIEYEADTQKYNRQLARIRKNNDGKGKISIVAEEDGIVSKVYVKKGTLIKKDEENDLLLSLSENSPDKIALNVSKTVALAITGKTQGIAAIGSSVQITTDEKDVHYGGKCISNAWNGKSYAFTLEDKARVSSVIMDKKSNGVIIVQMEQSDFTDTVNLKNCRAFVNTMTLKDAIVLPGEMVYTEEVKSGSVKRDYVWKLIDGAPVKEYVIKGTDFGIGNGQNTVILSGVSEGDILADEINQM